MLTVNFVKFPEAARILMLKGAKTHSCSQCLPYGNHWTYRSL